MDEISAEMAQNPALPATGQRELLSLQLAQQIAEARKRPGLSQAQLAARIGTKPTGVARMECAGTTGVTTTTLAKIAAATNSRLSVQLTSRTACRWRIVEPTLGRPDTDPQRPSTPEAGALANRQLKE
ncbi:MAG TPA: helix-turn-helix transcriptional regulator [Methylomirabilota bacterium]|nr:helix-turn-helix transcriptional regulator [Methylomirabilota bacterium]